MDATMKQKYKVNNEHIIQDITVKKTKTGNKIDINLSYQHHIVGQNLISIVKGY